MPFADHRTKTGRLADPAVARVTSHPSDERLGRQAWKVWFACAAWPVVVFLMPGVWSASPLLGLAFAVFPGIWTYCWLGVLMHEASHGYFRGVNNRAVYVILSLCLFMDPQIFKATHATHHLEVNTWRDLQIHPLGKIENRHRRRLVNAAEIAFGDLFFIVAGTLAVIGDDRLRRRYSAMAGVFWNLAWVAMLAAVLAASAHAFSLGIWATLAPAVISIWLCAVVLRHNELLQHGGLIVEGDLAARNMATRNLARTGLAARLFLFLTHDDAAMHVLHHTETGVYSRPFGRRFTAPDGAAYITMGAYMRVLGRLLRGIDPEPTAPGAAAQGAR